VRVTVPAAAAPTTIVSAPTPLSFRLDTTGSAKYTRRLVSGVAGRPKTVSIASGGQTSTFTVLLMNGAEKDETGWTATQFKADSTNSIAGKFSWSTIGIGELRSPIVTMPADVDTVSVMFWNRYDGRASFSPVLRVQGAAPAWYPERVTVGGVKGKKLVLDFVPSGLSWNIDEIAIVAHTGTVTAPVAGANVLKPSENPVRRGTVYFTWPFSSPTGDIEAYDFSGHRVWKTTVATGGIVPWDIAAAGLPNGVYVVVARSAGQTLRLKLFVVRDGR
jgi:hypothetical protein